MSEEVYKCKKCGKTFRKPDELTEYRAHCLNCDVKTVAEKAPDDELKVPDVQKSDVEEAPNGREDEVDKMEAGGGAIQSSEITPRNGSVSVARAKEQNACRGYFEDDKEGICLKYSNCDECWSHFGESA